MARRRRDPRGAHRGAACAPARAARRLPLPRRGTTTCSTSARPSRCAPACARTSAAATPGGHRRSWSSGSSGSRSIVTQSEGEALHLEQNLIKRHRPPFNVRLRDDKSYPYIAVTVEDEYPRVMFTRERHRRGVVYFGPYANAKKVRETLDVLNRVFRYRPCEGPQPGRHSGIPCLDYHIERCFAPCVGYVSKEDYRAIDRRRHRVPLGRHACPIQRAARAPRCRRRPTRHEFEEAARYRNRLVRRPPPRRAAGGRPPATRHGRRDRHRGAAATWPPCRSSRCATGAWSTATASPSRTPPARTRRRSSRRSASSTTAAAPSVPPLVVVPPRRGRPRAPRGVPLRAAGSSVEVRAAQRGEKRRLQELAQRNAELALEQRGARHRAPAAAPDRGARGAARGAQPGEPADPDRMLRHLEHPGRVAGRLDGRVRGRGAEEGALPQVRRAHTRAGRTTSR